MSIELLLPWRGVAAAFVVSLAWVGLFRLLRRSDLASLGAGIALAVGWVLALGLVTGTPRQLPERLPALVLGGALAGFVLAVAARRGAVSVLLAVLGLAGAAWWLAGGPLTLSDLRRSLVLLLALAALGAAGLLALRGPVGASVAMALLAAGFWLFGPPGPWFLLALIGLAAALGSLPAGGWGPAAALPVSIGLAALAAGPVLARGATADWLVAAAPFAALWLGPALGGRIGGRAGEPVGWAMAGLLPLIFVWLLQRGH